jgi:hypothetical protein
MKSEFEVFKKIIHISKYKVACRLDIKVFPKPYYKNINSIKAIVIGADPSNPQNKTFSFVFGLEQGEKSPYFRSILKNLRVVDLNLDNIYVQNLCCNYFNKVTDENDLFTEIANSYWLPHLKSELDNLFHPHIPVFVTAWKALTVLSPSANNYVMKKSKIYRESIIFTESLLDRPVIALFRGGADYYNLSKPDYHNYVSAISEYLN